MNITASVRFIHPASTLQHGNHSSIHQHIHSAITCFPSQPNLSRPSNQKPTSHCQTLCLALRLLVVGMCTFTRTAFKMCGHTEYRGTRCSPPITHKNNKHELCKKTPVYLQCTKNGICTQCRTRNWKASMTKSSKVPIAEQQHDNKGTRSGLAVGSRDEVSLHVSAPII